MGFLDSVKNALKGVVTAPPPSVAPEPVRPTPESTSESTSEAGTVPEAGAVPQPPAPRFTTYTIRTGDTLGDIGRRHGVTRDELARVNGIDEPDLIRPGQELRIPAR
jgi:LysM repeat protein